MQTTFVALLHKLMKLREKLHLAHERQKDYYDRRSHGSRNQSGDSVWLWNPAPHKVVAPKFHEPWTSPYKVTKRLSDVTYKVFDARRQTTTIVHFDRLKKSSVAPRPGTPMNSAKKQSSSDSDSQESGDYVPPSAPIARKRGRPPKLHAAASFTSPAMTKTALTWPNHLMYASKEDRRRLCRRRCSRECCRRCCRQCRRRLSRQS